jgi:hypothetical protein
VALWIHRGVRDFGWIVARIQLDVDFGRRNVGRDDHAMALVKNMLADIDDAPSIAIRGVCGDFVSCTIPGK